MAKRKNVKSNRCGDFLQDQDVFTEHVQFTFNGGETEFKTRVGGFCSILMFTIVLTFAIYQAIKMFKLEQFSI